MKHSTVKKSMLGLVAFGALLLSACSAKTDEAKPAAPEAAAAAPATIRVVGPAAPPTLPLLRMADANVLGDTKIEFERWESIDQLTAAVTTGADVIAAPLTTGATLAQGGADLKLLNVSAWAVMGIVTNDDSIRSIDDLAGKQIHISLRASAIDYTTQLVLEQHGLTDKVEIVYADLTTASDQFLAGQITTLVTVEPQVTMLLAKDANARSIVDFEQEWREITGSDVQLPTAGTFVNGAFAKEHPETVKKFQQAYVEAAKWIADNPEEAGELASKQLGMPAPIIAAAIPKIDWAGADAAAAKPAVELYYSKLFKLWPDSIGGALPDASFYLQ